MSTAIDHSDKTTNWWDTPEGAESIRQDSLRYLIHGLKKTEVGGYLYDIEDDPRALLIGATNLREELLAWAESQVTA